MFEETVPLVPMLTYSGIESGQHRVFCFHCWYTSGTSRLASSWLVMLTVGKGVVRPLEGIFCQITKCHRHAIYNLGQSDVGVSVGRDEGYSTDEPYRCLRCGLSVLSVGRC